MNANRRTHLSPEDVAARIDHTALKPATTEAEIRHLCNEATTCHFASVVKVIVEAALLTEFEKRMACILAAEAGADFVKTSTGFSGGGATVEDTRLMRQVVGPQMGVKASGGIRDAASALDLLDAGATRLGVSAGVAIVRGMTSGQSTQLVAVGGVN